MEGEELVIWGPCHGRVNGGGWVFAMGGTMGMVVGCG